MGGGGGLLVTEANHQYAAMLRWWWTIRNVVSRRTAKCPTNKTEVVAIVQSRLFLISRVRVQEINALHADPGLGPTTERTHTGPNAGAREAN
jgi:hypothetical protein